MRPHVQALPSRVGMLTPPLLTGRNGNMEVSLPKFSLLYVVEPTSQAGFESFLLATNHCLGLVGGEIKHGNHIVHFRHTDSSPKRDVCSWYWPRGSFSLPPPGKCSRDRRYWWHIHQVFDLTAGQSRTSEDYNKARSTEGLMCTLPPRRKSNEMGICLHLSFAIMIDF